LGSPEKSSYEKRMKNQYVGDINDYFKYGILRTLAAGGFTPMHIGWMLTPDDSRSDGSLTSYLSQPANYASYDPALFELMGSVFKPGCERSIGLIETGNILPGAEFESALVPQALAEREAYMQRIAAGAVGKELIFLDPDNGLEVKSVPKGRKNADKFLFFDEVEALFATGASLLIYQHYPRVQRESYTRTLCAGLSTTAGGAELLTIQSSRVLFALLLQPGHALRGPSLVERFQHTYADQLTPAMRRPHDGFAASRV
jgi:hypothetical protein